jgi:hypothetical protein
MLPPERATPSRESPEPLKLERSPLLAKEESSGEKWPTEFCPRSDLHVIVRVLLHSANLRHGTHSFTSLLKEGMLRIFTPEKIRQLRPGLNPRTWVPELLGVSIDMTEEDLSTGQNT